MIYLREDSADSLISGNFVRPDDDDPNFRFWPFKAVVVIARQRQQRALRPFSDYAIRFYEKYDKESFEIAKDWNQHFSHKDIDRENSLDRMERGEK